MFSTIKGKVIFFISLVLVISAVVNIYFTKRDVGNAMLIAQEKSAKNILHSLDLIIQDDYHNLLSDKRTMTLSHRTQLKHSAEFIKSVFKAYSDSVSNDISQKKTIERAFKWLNNAPFKNINYFIIDNNSNILSSSNKSITNDQYKAIKDRKDRNISQVMRFSNLRERGDYAVINSGGKKTKLFLAFFLPFSQWEYTIVTSIEISSIEAQAKKKRNKIIDSLTEFSKQLNITEHGFVYMFDSKNNILIDPPEQIKNNIHSSVNTLTGNTVIDDIKTFSKSDISELRYNVTTENNEKAMIAYCNYFKPLKWYISVIVPVDEINQPANKLVVRQSLIIIVMFILGLIAVFFLVTRIAQPLNLLSSYVKTIPDQDFTKTLEKKTPIDNLPEKYKDEVGGLAASFLMMRMELGKNIRNLIKATATRERIESELNIARDIQLGLVPKTFPSFPEYKEFELDATLIPAKEIGGDLYDFFLIDDDTLCFALGDVSDKGIPSALLMVVTRTLIRTLSEKTSSPSEIMYKINNIISADNPRTMFVTLIIGIMKIKTGKIIYANGGHNPPVVVKNGKEAFYNKGKNEPLVGAIEDMEYSDLELDLSAGESFFLYTDGVNEAMNPDAVQYSNEKLLSQIEQNRNKPAGEIIDKMLKSIREHSQTAPQSDDIAMLMIKYHGK